MTLLERLELRRRGRRLRYMATEGRVNRTRDLMIKPATDDPKDVFVAREDLARRFIAGDGLEIGAASWPTRVPRGETVRYVD